MKRARRLDLLPFQRQQGPATTQSPRPCPFHREIASTAATPATAAPSAATAALAACAAFVAAPAAPSARRQRLIRRQRRACGRVVASARTAASATTSVATSTPASASDDTASCVANGAASGVVGGPGWAADEVGRDGGDATVGEALVAWLERLGAEGVLNVTVGASALGGVGVFAARSFEAGERIFELPQAAVMNADPSPGGAAASEACSPEARLALALLRERQLGAASTFIAYLGVLPSPEALQGHPLLWPEDLDVTELLAGSARARRIVGSTRKGLQADVAAMVVEGASPADAAWALAVVTSRMFASVVTSTASSGVTCPHLNPLLDSMNTATAECEHDKSQKPWSVRATFTSEGSAEIWADRAVASGEELLLTYGPLSSAELLAAYGFVPFSANVFEGVDLVVDLRHALAASPMPLRGEQEAALQRFLKWNSSSRLTFQLRSGVAGDAHAGGLLLPVARLLSLHADVDVAAAGVHIFWMCPGGAGRPASLGLQLEVAARRLVQCWLDASLVANEVAAGRLEELGAEKRVSLVLCELFRRLLSGERRLLEVEHAAAEEMCAAFGRAETAGVAALEELQEELWDDESGFYGAG